MSAYWDNCSNCHGTGIGENRVPCGRVPGGKLGAYVDRRKTKQRTKKVKK